MLHTPSQVEIITGSSKAETEFETPTAIYRDNTNTNGIDTRSRVVILDLEAGETAWVTARSPVESDPDAVLTSWTGLHLEAFLDPNQLSMFAVSRNESECILLHCTNANSSYQLFVSGVCLYFFVVWNTTFTQVIFDNVTINVGDNFNMDKSEYMSPITGPVFMSYTVGQKARRVSRTKLVGDGHETEVSELYRSIIIV